MMIILVKTTSIEDRISYFLYFLYLNCIIFWWHVWEFPSTKHFKLFVGDLLLIFGLMDGTSKLLITFFIVTWTKIDWFGKFLIFIFLNFMIFYLWFITFYFCLTLLIPIKLIPFETLFQIGSLLLLRFERKFHLSHFFLLSLLNQISPDIHHGSKMKWLEFVIFMNHIDIYL
jgi:hypothetical protein